MAYIEIRDVSFAYPKGNEALQDVNLYIEEGEKIAIIGQNGAGKTTFVQGLLRALKVKDSVLSPTFVMAQTYQGRMTVHHLDFYRLIRH